MLEATRRVTLFVRMPGARANGQVCHQFVEFVDLVPTLGDLVGLDLPENLEGTSFVPLLANPDRPWKRAVFMVGNNPDEQAVRTRTHSYLTFRDRATPAALFDLEKDPWETVNVANDPAHTAVREELAGLLRVGWKAALPPAGAVSPRGAAQSSAPPRYVDSSPRPRSISPKGSIMSRPLLIALLALLFVPGSLPAQETARPTAAGHRFACCDYSQGKVSGLTHQVSRGFGPVLSRDSRSSIPQSGAEWQYSCLCWSSPP